MYLVLAAIVAFSTEGPGVVWADAFEIAEKGLSVPEAGVYHVWAWERGDAGSGDGPTYAWSKRGEMTLEAGPVSVDVGPNDLTFVLSTDPAFDPAGAASNMRVFNPDGRVADERAQSFRDTHTYFTFPNFPTREAWEAHAAVLRRRLLVGCGLYPLPERTPLNARVFDPVTHDDYIVEKVTFESRPGFLVTGNLYRPVGEGPFPAVLCPHGHWSAGRLENSELGSIPGRCITLARMGMVAFSYDMVGYVDSKQLPHSGDDPLHKLWGVHPFAFQLWNSIRAVDFVQGLPYVDPARVGCTGASGGGTQTFALSAVDDRIVAAAPVNMISCSMQGGCICENAPLIRLGGVSNMDIGALMAPRPLLMVSATGDWTRETPWKEYPAIRSVYALYGAEGNIEAQQFHAEHNYNKASREAVYPFLAKHLLGDAEKFKGFSEPPFQVESEEALRIFPGDAQPEGLPSGEQIIAETIASTQARWKALLPADKAGLDAFRATYAGALSDVFGVRAPGENDIEPVRPREAFQRRDGHIVEKLVIRRASVGDAIPAIFYRPDDSAFRDAVLVVHGRGKAALVDPMTGGPGALVKELLAKGRCVLAIDAFLTGEHHDPRSRTVRATGSFPDTFEPSDTACRVQDVLTAAAYLRSRRDLTGTVDVVGLEQGGLWAFFGSALDGRIRKTFVDAFEFNNESDEAWAEQYYVPCIRAVGDVATAAALLAPRPLWIARTADAFKTADIEGVYRAEGSAAPTVTREPVDPAALASWLTQ